MSTNLSVYIHIPFCHARCGYCDFVTFTGKDDRAESYVEEVLQEAALYQTETSGRVVSTIFLGGGTPSILNPSQVERLFSGLNRELTLSTDCEITLEANPESIASEKANAWRAAGINRVSMGLQVMDDVLLARLGRLHTTQQFRDAYQVLRAGGYKNLSIDLIYGLPGQTLAGWKSTLEQTAALEPEHLSLYALTVEAGTPFAAAKVKVHSDQQAEMYAWAREFLTERGYDQYEISNFARPGFECRHNLVYWRQGDYLGLGVGAVGYMDRVRWENVKTLEAYTQSLAGGQKPRMSEEALDPKTHKFERLMLGLRLREGLEWGDETDPKWLSERTRLNKEGLLEQVGTRWRIPDRAVALTNQVLLPFL